MHAYFGSYPDALSNTVDIAARCNLDFDFKTYHFPNFDAGSERSVDELFEEKVRAGYDEIISRIKNKNADIDEAVYQDRLHYEIATIKDMGFPGYFFILSDFIRYAKQAGVPVGPGRGSAAGSLVAYSLGITDLDPISHGLIFERFLNPKRSEPPDFDIDYSWREREDVQDYIFKRYGHKHTALLGATSTFKGKSIFRELGKVYGLPKKEIDSLVEIDSESEEDPFSTGIDCARLLVQLDGATLIDLLWLGLALALVGVLVRPVLTALSGSLVVRVRAAGS